MSIWNRIDRHGFAGAVDDANGLVVVVDSGCVMRGTTSEPLTRLGAPAGFSISPPSLSGLSPKSEGITSIAMAM